MNVPGKLGIKPLQARINRNTEWFGKMNPFIQFEFQGQRYSSSICREGGTNPFWTDTIYFNKLSGYLLYIALLDHQTMKQHDMIGTAEVNISDIFIKTQPTQKVIDLYHDGQLSAQIKLSFYFQPIITQISNLGGGGGSLMMSKKSRQNNNQPYYSPQNTNYQQGYSNPQPANYYQSQQSGPNPIQIPQQFNQSGADLKTNIVQEVSKNIVGQLIMEQFGSQFKNHLQKQMVSSPNEKFAQNNSYNNNPVISNNIKQAESSHKAQTNQVPNSVVQKPANSVGEYIKNANKNNVLFVQSRTENVESKKSNQNSRERENENKSKSKKKIEILQEKKTQPTKPIKKVQSSQKFTADQMDDLLK